MRQRSRVSTQVSVFGLDWMALLRGVRHPYFVQAAQSVFVPRLRFELRVSFKRRRVESVGASDWRCEASTALVFRSRREYSNSISDAVPCCDQPMVRFAQPEQVPMCRVVIPGRISFNRALRKYLIGLILRSSSGTRHETLILRFNRQVCGQVPGQFGRVVALPHLPILRMATGWSR